MIKVSLTELQLAAVKFVENFCRAMNISAKGYDIEIIPTELKNQRWDVVAEIAGLPRPHNLRFSLRRWLCGIHAFDETQAKLMFEESVSKNSIPGELEHTNLFLICYTDTAFGEDTLGFQFLEIPEK